MGNGVGADYLRFRSIPKATGFRIVVALRFWVFLNARRIFLCWARMIGGRAFSPFTGRAFPLDHPSVVPAFSALNAVWGCDGAHVLRMSLGGYCIAVSQ